MDGENQFVSVAGRTALTALAKTANREHQKATSCATDAIEHAVKAGDALAKARDLCDAGEWGDFVSANSQGSLRTAQKYMRLAKNWRMLASRGGEAITSQAEAAKALTAIIRGGDSPPPPKRARGTRRERGACQPVGAANSVGAVVEFPLSVMRQTVAALDETIREVLAEIPPSTHARAATAALRRARDRIAVGVERLLGAIADQPSPSAEAATDA